MGKGEKLKVLIVGFGEIGTAIHSIVSSDAHKVFILDDSKESAKEFIPTKDDEIDVMHICFPYSDNFVDYVKMYYKKHYPKLVIIESTVPVGTTRRIYDELNMPIIHSPNRGVHPNLEKSIRTFTKVIGGIQLRPTLLAFDYYQNLGLNVGMFNSSEETELAKLLSTSYYGLCISWFREMDLMCKHFACDFDNVVKKFNESYNEGYAKLNKTNVIRPVLFVPEGGCGGHCVIENAIMLYEQLPKEHDKKFLEALFSMGKLDESSDRYKHKPWLFCEYVGKEKTQRQIANEFGFTDTNIGNWMRELSIPTRDATWLEEGDKE